MSLARLLSPEAIAVVGLSVDPSKHGGRVVANLKRLGFRGEVWGVNPGMPDVPGVEVFASLDRLPSSPDLVVCAIPAGAVPGTVRAAGTVQAGGVVVFAGGFREVGEDGAALQDDLVAAAREAGVAVLGPNSGGVIRPSVGLAASFLTCLDRPASEVRPGPVGLVTQSGGTGSYVHNLAAERGSGLAVSVSTGNEAVSGLSDGIDALVELDEVKVIALVMETVRRGRAFMESVQRAHQAGKPVVACRIGSSPRGERLMTTHTGAMAAPSKLLDGVLDSLGVTVAETPEEMLAVAEVMARAGEVGGERIGVITHSGGIAILLSDLADRIGLELPQPSMALAGELAPFLQLGTAANPLDMGAIIGGPGRFADVVERFAASGEFDAVLAVSTAHPPAHTVERAEGLVALDPQVPVVHLWMAGDVADAGLQMLRAAALPVVTEPRAAIRAMGGLGRTLHRTVPSETPRTPMPAVPATEHAAKEVLASWGLTVVEGGLAGSVDQAVALASSLGGRVVMKVSSPDIPHKTDVGGVVLGIGDPAAARQAYQQIVTGVSGLRPDARIEGVRVERMTTGVEAIVGMITDRLFGPMVMVSLGGVATEGLGVERWGPAPVDPEYARRMVEGVAGLEATLGRRGDPGVAVRALSELVARASEHFVASGLLEVEMNPVAWNGERWEILDAVMRGE